MVDVNSMAFVLGAYIGETMRKNNRGASGSTGLATAIRCTTAEPACFPDGMVHAPASPSATPKMSGPSTAVHATTAVVVCSTRKLRRPAPHPQALTKCSTGITTAPSVTRLRRHTCQVCAPSVSTSVNCTFFDFSHALNSRFGFSRSSSFPHAIQSSLIFSACFASRVGKVLRRIVEDRRTHSVPSRQIDRDDSARCTGFRAPPIERPGNRPALLDL